MQKNKLQFTHKKMYFRLYVALIILLSSTPVIGKELIYTGISEDALYELQIKQKESNWCWAASIQMVLNYHGINITQEQIVDKTHGRDELNRLFNATATVQNITTNLNHTGINTAGISYSVKSSGNWGAPTAARLLWELSNDHPIIAGYRTGPYTDHAVVITGAWYEQSTKGPIVQYLVIQDPNPIDKSVETSGQVTYIANRFARAIKAHWYVRTM